MARETTTVTVSMMGLYHLTSDPNNNTGYTIEEVTKMLEEHGADYQIEVTVDHPVPDPVVDVVSEEIPAE